MELSKKKIEELNLTNKFELYTQEQLEKLYSALKLRLVNPITLNEKYIGSIVDVLTMVDKAFDKKLKNKL